MVSPVRCRVAFSWMCLARAIASRARLSCGLGGFQASFTLSVVLLWYVILDCFTLKFEFLRLASSNLPFCLYFCQLVCFSLIFFFIDA